MYHDHQLLWLYIVISHFLSVLCGYQALLRIISSKEVLSEGNIVINNFLGLYVISATFKRKLW